MTKGEEGNSHNHYSESTRAPAATQWLAVCDKVISRDYFSCFDFGIG